MTQLVRIGLRVWYIQEPPKFSK